MTSSPGHSFPSENNEETHDPLEISESTTDIVAGNYNSIVNNVNVKEDQYTRLNAPLDKFTSTEDFPFSHEDP